MPGFSPQLSAQKKGIVLRGPQGALPQERSEARSPDPEVQCLFLYDLPHSTSFSKLFHKKKQHRINDAAFPC
jgi:hypothetical protein